MIGLLLFSVQLAVLQLYSEQGYDQYIQTINKWEKGWVNRVSDVELSLLLKRYEYLRRGEKFRHFQQKGKARYNILKQ